MRAHLGGFGMKENTIAIDINDSPTEHLRPTAIILADGLVSQELEEIFGPVEAASLVIAGRSVIEHVLLELQELHFKQCIVLAGNNATEILNMVGNDGRWGMPVNVMAFSCSTEQILRDFKPLSEPNGLLVVEADSLRSFCVKEFLEKAESSECQLLEVHDGVGFAGITLLKPSEADIVLAPTPITIESIMVNALESAREFHQANFDLIAGMFGGLEPSVVFNRKCGRRQHWSSRDAPTALGDWSDVMIEKHCRVGRQVLLKSVILNHGVQIEDQVQLDNTVVMPNSVVSEKRFLSDSIVHQGAVFQL